ncbi:hypothetical protein [Pseudarthrobacter sp. PS3-L1]|uniref:hypothetical protein n=1 Tax=Pseudarthrobacter sp. PS3-L1 TaxID=3046207 RepID=UPI0024B8BE11|nr:hypothetical protein [Pseudarthrobacter sp. PS3-L1]MDJ0320455.1 hypothetical protein [Pseudarthrobacter sp. PS3-L1]
MTVAIPAGILLPQTLLQTDLFAILATFVAINTIFYVALAVSKILPKVYITDWIRRNNERSETRSIHPAPNDQGPGGI